MANPESHVCRIAAGHATMKRKPILMIGVDQKTVEPTTDLANWYPAVKNPQLNEIAPVLN